MKKFICMLVVVVFSWVGLQLQSSSVSEAWRNLISFFSDNEKRQSIVLTASKAQINLTDYNCNISLYDSNRTVRAIANFDGQVPKDVNLILQIKSIKGIDKVSLKWDPSLGNYGKYTVICDKDYFVPGIEYTFSIETTSKTTSVAKSTTPFVWTFGKNNNSNFIWPVGGKSVKTQNFSSSHSGIDISSSSKSPSILAVGDGTVVNVYNNCNHKDNLKDNCNKGTGFGAYGNVIVIKHNDNTYSMYAHLLKDSIKVSVGQTVKKGDIIATMGKSGASKGIHLHFEIRTIANKPSSAVNPSLYLPKH